MTWNTTAGAKTVTATPAVGDLIIIACANSGRTTAQPPTVTDNNSSGVYVQIGTPHTKSTSADSMWFFARTAPIPAATSTIFTMTPTATDTGGGLDVFAVTGMMRFGANCIRQSGGQDNVASGTPSVVMPQAVLTANPCIGMVNTTTNGSANSAPPTGWTEASDLGYTTPANGIETCFISSGETLTTLPFTAVAPSAFGSMIVELDTNPPTLPTWIDNAQPFLAQ